MHKAKLEAQLAGLHAESDKLRDRIKEGPPDQEKMTMMEKLMERSAKLHETWDKLRSTTLRLIRQTQANEARTLVLLCKPSAPR